MTLEKTTVPRLRRALPLTVAIFTILASACATHTRYQPKREDQIQLVMQGGKFHFHKNKRTAPISDYPQLGFGRVEGRGTEMLSCDDEAAGYFENAQGRFHQGQQYSLFALAATLLSVVVAPTTPFLTPTALALYFMSIAETQAGMSQAVDAMNRHNDAVACARPQNVAPVEDAPADDEDGATPEPAAGAPPGEPLRLEEPVPPTLDEPEPEPSEEEPISDPVENGGER